MRIGEKVVCIRTNQYTDGHGVFKTGAVKGHCYIIEAVIKCRCGNIGFDVGIPSTSNQKRSNCNRCNQTISYDGWIQSSSRFRPLDYIDCTDELALEAIIKRKEVDIIPVKTKPDEVEI